MIALVVITDGRIDYLRQTIASAAANLPEIGLRILIDDSGDPDHAEALADEWPWWYRVSNPRRRGFGQTVRVAWESALSLKPDHIFHLEEDFTFNGPVDIDALIGTLDENPQLSQVALKRQPVNDQERAAGGFMETWPADKAWQKDGFVEHWVNFTTNPCLIPADAAARACARPGALTEPAVTHTLLGAGYSFGYAGGLTDAPAVTHIGEQRMSGWMA